VEGENIRNSGKRQHRRYAVIMTSNSNRIGGGSKSMVLSRLLGPHSWEKSIADVSCIETRFLRIAHASPK